MQIAFLVPDEPTAQDFVGPWEVLSRWPDRTLHLVSSHPGLRRCDSGMEVMVPTPLADVPHPDIVIVPGGSDPYAAMADAEAIRWLREVAPGVRWFGTVCTGAAVLARAGLLEGRPATTHWAFREDLRSYGVDVVEDRVVVAGNVVTSAGITAGIDMALTLTLLERGEEYAEAVQLALEYDPRPPTDSGTPDKAAPAVLDFVRSSLEAGVLAKNPDRRAGR